MQFQNLRDFQPTLVKPKSLIYIEFLCQLFLYLIYLGSNFVFKEFGFYLFIVGCAGSSLLLFFSRGKWGLLFSCNAWASHHGDLSYAGAGALGHTGFSSCGSPVLEHGLNSCGMACGIFPHQGLNLCLPHWQVDSLLLHQQGRPWNFSFEWITHAYSKKLKSHRRGISERKFLLTSLWPTRSPPQSELLPLAPETSISYQML